MSLLNLRDFGGYPTTGGKAMKRGVLFRSGDLDRATTRELRSLESLGLKTVIDLRPSKEQKKRTRQIPGARTMTIPFDVDQTARERVGPLLLKKDSQGGIEEAIRGLYTTMVDDQQGPLGNVFRMLLPAENSPLLIHCRAGKDRTGFVCAVVQWALGFEAPFILQDYLLSNDHFLPEARRISRLTKWMTLGLLPTENFTFALTVRSSYIQVVIDRIGKTYGGIGPYLERCGIGSPEVEILKERFLDKRSAWRMEERR